MGIKVLSSLITTGATTTLVNEIATTGLTITGGGVCAIDGFSGNLTGTSSNSTCLGGVAADSFLRSDVADIKTSGNLTFNDSVQANFGTDGDMCILHSGGNGVIKNNTGNLYIRTVGNEEAIFIGANSCVQLYHDNVAKLNTLSAGACTHGTHYATSFNGSGSGITALNASNISTGTLANARLETSSIPARANLIGSGVNLNTCTELGFSYQNSNANAAAGSNYPVPLAGSLRVTEAAGSIQEYITYRCADSGNGVTMFLRGCYSGAWSPWHKVWHSGNDGSGSGLDADSLDGLSAGSFVRKDLGTQTSTFPSGCLVFAYNDASNVDHIRSDDGANAFHFVHDASTATVGNSQLYAGAVCTSGCLRGGFVYSTGTICAATCLRAPTVCATTTTRSASFCSPLTTTTGYIFRTNCGCGCAKDWVAISDGRKKCNVVEYECGLDKINQLNPVCYRWKQSHQEDMGFIAQEVEEVEPLLVSGSEECGYGLKYDKFAAMSIKAIQELSCEVKDLKEELKRLKE